MELNLDLHYAFKSHVHITILMNDDSGPDNVMVRSKQQFTI